MKLHLILFLGNRDIFNVEDLAINFDWGSFHFLFHIKDRTFGNICKVIVRGNFYDFFPKLVFDFIFDFVLPIGHQMIMMRFILNQAMNFMINFTRWNLADDSIIKFGGRLSLIGIL